MKLPLLVGTLLLLFACASRGPEALLRDRNAHEPSRLAAVAQVSNPELLWRTMANARDVLTVRQAAASRLWALDGDAFWKRLEKEYAQVNHGPLWNWLCAEAGKAKEQRALRAMVLSFGKLRPYADPLTDYPESFPILLITNIPEHPFYLMSILDGRTAPNDVLQQRAAWMAFARVGPAHPNIRSMADHIPSTSPLYPLHTLAARLSEFPIVDEELDTVIAQAKLPEVSHPPVPPRDLALLRRPFPVKREGPGNSTLYIPKTVARTTDAPLLSQVAPSAADHAVCVELKLSLTSSPSLVASLFAEADADLSDKKTEHGGLLFWNGKNEVVFEAVPASFRRHDEIYLPPESLFEKLRDGLAHVHFHAQKHNNGEYAGPGKGDLEFVERNRVNAVVFTFVDKDTLNADAYFPGKIVVDLGCIKRPK